MICLLTEVKDWQRDEEDDAAVEGVELKVEALWSTNYFNFNFWGFKGIMVDWLQNGSDLGLSQKQLGCGLWLCMWVLGFWYILRLFSFNRWYSLLLGVLICWNFLWILLFAMMGFWVSGKWEIFFFFFFWGCFRLCLWYGMVFGILVFCFFLEFLWLL